MYYIQFNNEDGSTEEIELQQGAIFCKCSECGQAFVPYRIQFNKEFDSEEESFFWTACPDCIEKREVERSRRTQELAIEKLAETSSRYFKKVITPADIRQFLDDNRDVGFENIKAAAQERFGDSCHSDSARKEPRKPQIAQQTKSITIIPRRKHG